MSSLKVPVFFGSTLTLAIVVFQNRTPVYELMLLGIRFRPLPLGLLVAAAVLSGLCFGTILQRTGRRASPKSRSTAAPREGTKVPEFQTFQTSPESSRTEDSDEFDFSFNESENSDSDEPNFAEPNDQPTPPRSSSTKGWDTGSSMSWTEKPEDQEGGFWSRPPKAKPQKKRSGLASVTPINPERPAPSSKSENAGNADPSIVEAEYRIVTPYQREETDEFDDEFFDDFFEEDGS